MNNRQAYNFWSETYDTVENKTRDLEAAALRSIFSAGAFGKILEIGCGTGKNSVFLLTRARHLTGADFSARMLSKAKEKIHSAKFDVRRMDLREEWNFAAGEFDLIICSLALEHIENIDFVFKQAKKVLRPGGLFYIGELHPFKQYSGSKARFETGSGTFELECFVHHVSDYFAAGASNDFDCVELKEWFDNEDKNRVPRLLTMIFKAR